MSELTEKEFEAILALNADYRHAMFKRVAAEQGGFYLLVDKDGPLVLNDTECDEDNNLYSILPVWSHEKLASEYAKDNGHESMKPQFVTLDAWNYADSELSVVNNEGKEGKIKFKQFSSKKILYDIDSVTNENNNTNRRSYFK